MPFEFIGYGLENLLVMLALLAKITGMFLITQSSGTALAVFAGAGQVRLTSLGIKS